MSSRPNDNGVVSDCDSEREGDNGLAGLLSDNELPGGIFAPNGGRSSSEPGESEHDVPVRRHDLRPTSLAAAEYEAAVCAQSTTLAKLDQGEGQQTDVYELTAQLYETHSMVAGLHLTSYSS